VLDQASEAVFVALQDDLYLNGVRVQVNASNFRFHRNVIDVFRAHAISGIRFERGVQVEDLAKFFGLFLGISAPHGTALLKACADADLQRVLPVIHVSTDPNAARADFGEDDGTEGEPVGGSHEGGAVSLTAETARGYRPTLRGAGNRLYSQAVYGARVLLMPTTLNAGLEMRHAKRVVQPLVDGAFASEPVVVGLAGLTERDTYTYTHSVNVAGVAVTMGHVLGMDRRALADLGVASLLHDVGKSVITQSIFHPLEGFTDEERAAAERHPIEGAKLIARRTTLSSTALRCIRVALEHHVWEGEGGYPKLRAGWRSSLFTQIVATADCYINLHSRCGDLLERITPYQALGMMLGKLRERFEPAMLWALVQSVGFYPPGQLIELGDGSVGIVLAPNRRDLGRPHVRLLRGADGVRYKPNDPHELLPIPPNLSVRRPLVGAEAQTWDIFENAA
jgi:HD-GYP domain-containing protein (c-di-GMP phosphodiesterase class II)